MSRARPNVAFNEWLASPSKRVAALAGEEKEEEAAAAADEEDGLCKESCVLILQPSNRYSRSTPLLDSDSSALPPLVPPKSPAAAPVLGAAAEASAASVASASPGTAWDASYDQEFQEGLDWVRYDKLQAENHAERVAARAESVHKRRLLQCLSKLIACTGSVSGSSRDGSSSSSGISRRRSSRRRPGEPLHSNNTPISRHSSIRRRDFSTTAEIDRYQRGSQFIFHRGFSTRQNRLSNTQKRLQRRRCTKARFETPTQLSAFIKYINFGSFKVEDVTGSKQMIFHELKPPKWAELSKKRPALVSRTKEWKPAQHTYTDLDRPLVEQCKLKLKAPPPPPPILARKRSPVIHRPSGGSLRRSQTVSSLRRHSRYESLYPGLYVTWREYLQSVIYNQISFRLQCLRAPEVDSPGAVSEPARPPRESSRFSVEGSIFEHQSFESNVDYSVHTSAPIARNDLFYYHVGSVAVPAGAAAPAKGGDNFMNELIPADENSGTIRHSSHSSKRSLKLY
ncbi:Nis1p Ecym_5383 [Eremothecium cymbalariae DBVPG|uniref:Uncharacterized protein n=1 Tax=Eremothecium cymbalariae (strain CBS 270.75 / DBVPG 7215 / KCTC 17166 / NRRL Y-17582) TaxID=931890 RepID=I6NDJ6_ERECY|nr:hypothetical protein Ecym_5383 [Eremothecium cymbalariae DBVPG\